MTTPHHGVCAVPGKCDTASVSAMAARRQVQGGCQDRDACKSDLECNKYMRLRDGVRRQDAAQAQGPR